MIATGELAGGDTLEPTREAAAQWGVNRHTVRQAYQRLVRQGLVEAHPPRRFSVVSTFAPRPARTPEDPALAAFLEEILRTARERFRLGERELVLALGRHRERGPRAVRVTVVECNSVQAEDHGRQLAEAWDIRPVPFVLGAEDRLPPGPVVATFFHFEEIRKRWPRRRDDIRYLTVRPDPFLLRRALEFPWPEGRRRITVLADGSSEEARNLSADLLALFPADEYEHRLAIRAAWQERDPADPLDGPVLVAPRAWDGLHPTEREHPAVICVRYRVEAADLEAVGTHFGWRRVSGQTTGGRRSRP
jgi:DNA-binding transcriptional regulator YhcF (GntR family)